MTEEQKITELLKPRYKVIADYPNVEFFEIGAIIHGNGRFKNGKSISDYPHIFKPLEWWEEREEKDMPQYVKNAIDGYVFELISQSKHTPSDVIVGHYYEPKKWHEGSHSLYDLLPATKEEYLNQK